MLKYVRMISCEIELAVIKNTTEFRKLNITWRAKKTINYSRFGIGCLSD